MNATARTPVSLWRAARVKDWAHFLPLPVAGIAPELGWGGNAVAATRGALIAFAVLAFGYLLNGLADRHMDASTRKNPLVGALDGVHRWAGGSYRIALGVLVVSALGLSLLGPWWTVVATGMALGSGVVYSVGPRVKRFVGVGTVANATNFAPLLWVGVPVGAQASVAGMAPLTVAFVLLLLQNQILHEAADQREDRAGNVNTTYRWLGPSGSAGLTALIGLGIVATTLGATGLSVATFSLATVTAVVFVAGAPSAVLRYGTRPQVMGRLRLLHRVASVVLGAILFGVLRLGW